MEMHINNENVIHLEMQQTTAWWSIWTTLEVSENEQPIWVLKTKKRKVDKLNIWLKVSLEAIVEAPK